MNKQEQQTGRHVHAITILFLASLFTGICWWNIGSIFPFIASDLKIDISALGLLTASFLAGVGIFQIPSGIISMRIGLKRVIEIGTLLCSLGLLTNAFESDTVSMVVSRFIIGAGVALLFTPGVSLVARYYPKGKEGFGVGLYDACSLAGGIFGLIGATVLASLTSWRFVLISNGLAGLVIGLALFFIIPRDTMRQDFKVKTSSIVRILSDRWIIVIGVALLGLELASTLVGNFTVYFLSSGVNEGVIMSSLIASLYPVAGIIGTIAFGKLFDRAKSVKRLILVTGVLTGVALAISAVSSLGGSALSTSLVGSFSSAGFILCISAARQVKSHELEYEVLGVSWAITLSLVGSLFGPLYFSYSVISFGYEFAWISSSLLALVFLVPLVFAKE